MASLNLSIPLILASSSPRRRELLQQLGLQFEIVSPDINEDVRENESAESYVQRLAIEKASVILAQYPQHLIISADTTVCCDGEIMGKAETLEQAVAMWSKLSGRWHDVLTGVCVTTQQQQRCCVVSTKVQFQPLTAQQMQAYWATGEPLGKAGAYAIQGIASQFIPQIQGSYTNVVGLPLHEVVMMLQAFVNKSS